MQLSWGWQGLEDAPAEREEPAALLESIHALHK